MPGEAGLGDTGVMLLEPNLAVYHRALQEISQQFHTGHIPGSGPEQDHLSCFYAPYWRHISVKYNFQIHHVFYNLESALEWWQASENNDRCLPTRMKLETKDIAVIHFSGTLKMWDRDYQGTGESDEAFATRILRNCNADGCHRWIDRKASDEEYAKHCVAMQGNGGTKEFHVLSPNLLSEFFISL